jgi:hypothetical protein
MQSAFNQIESIISISYVNLRYRNFCYNRSKVRSKVNTMRLHSIAILKVTCIPQLHDNDAQTFQATQT